MSEDVMFKGSRYGLQLVLSEKAKFSDIEKQLQSKLESAFNFFCKVTVIRIAANRLDRQEFMQLTSLLEQYGLALKPVTEEKIPEPAAVHAEIPGIGETTVIEKTVRGGDEVICNGSVIIHGNVNPGAVVTAGGDIEVHGICRGIVHAGAFGNAGAAVVADCMMPMQIRIAELVARAPDYVEKPDHRERAVVKDGQIVIEPVERNEEAGR